MTTVNQPVHHWHHGDGVILECLEEGCVKVQFNARVRMISEENLTDENGTPLVVPPVQPTLIHHQTVFTSRPPQIAEISDSFYAYLADTNVDIRVMASSEHKAELEYLLNQVGAHLPEGFECVAVGENGGVTRPWAPGFVCRFKTPPEGLCRFRFRDEGDGWVSTASTSFALGLIRRGFPITTWKGKL